MNENNDRLRDLFKQLQNEAPPSDFNEKLMLKLAKLQDVKARQRKKYKLIFTSISVVAGLAGIFGLTWFLFLYYGVEVNITQLVMPALDFDASEVEYPSILVMLAVAVLLLLGTDLLIRRSQFSRERKASMLK